MGDVVGINYAERFYSSFVIFVSTFGYAFLFGNLALMVEGLTPKFKKLFANNYKQVVEYARNAKLDSFLPKIHVNFT